MEFQFDINLLLGDIISVVDKTLKPFSSNPTNANQRRNELYQVIDDMGRASARAQGLRCPITSASNMKDSKYNLYIIKDEYGVRGNGAVLGMLKVGPKKLFVFDQHGNQHEVEPLCVLDFYVHESCQRQGYGRMLFEEMLSREHANVRHLAIDRPSPKFLSFLQKHYGLKASIPQVNNFVIFDGFFSEKNGIAPGGRKGSNRMHPVDRPYGGSGYQVSPVGPTNRLPSMEQSFLPEPVGARPTQFARPVSGQRNDGSMPARQAMYCRHQAIPSPVEHPQPPFVNNNFASPSADAACPSPPPIRRDGPSRDFIQLLNENNSNSYMDRRGGHLRTNQTSYISPASKTLQSNMAVVNVFGVPQRAWPATTTTAATAVATKLPVHSPSVAAYRKNQRTALW